MTAVSITSKQMVLGSIAYSSAMACNSSGRPKSVKTEGDKLMDKSKKMFFDSHCFLHSNAFLVTQVVKGFTDPLASACEIKSSGMTSLSFVGAQRTSTSAPTILPLLISI